ncbi:uncharacterized protein PGTG_19754 [Puccinia graminis f. sp. tritici CRL 75-36-700-3]|uniref:SWI5-dependent HO expression protein 3 n=1 Tax=Puccinia graminis f. sp. tritici (strain CRL 75-36-700-3 / race SCCL) TaxID=418459 RepID=E3LBD2_PUCGT|nr:uncharacterized protein PGTG_19754 [Puccinia graminis f. sp. tritici CRL 75-36-700-3]EFP93857.2 hypothetical protein PGTG_19754 [Puccinia graminis f. sp. tritici CRL 75-36-700-3]
MDSKPASSSSSSRAHPSSRKTSISADSRRSLSISPTNPRTTHQKSQLPLPLRTQESNILSPSSTKFSQLKAFHRSVSSSSADQLAQRPPRTLSRKPSSTKTLPTKNSNCNFKSAQSTPPTPNGQPTHQNHQVTMLKEQLAKLQSELRIARGQVATLDNQLTRSKTPPSKTPPFGSSLNSSQRLQQQQQQQHSSHSTQPSRPATPSRSPKSRKKSNSASKSHSLRKSSSSANSEQTDGLSIRFISGPGIHSSRSPQPSSIMDDSSLPISDSGYIKDPDGVWVPLNSPPAHSPSLNLSSSARYKSPSPSEAPRGISRIPISAVALGRVLAGDPLVPDHQSFQADIAEEQEPAEDHCDSVPRNSEYSSGASLSSPQIDDQNTTASTEPPGSHPPAVSRQPRGNPFFSSGGGRDRGAMIHQNSNADRTTNGGNTGKVITTLQSDLLYARTALDQSKSQLRLSQRAVESLNRQTEDLKESMSRLRLENEGLSKMLSRKERTVSELMDRLKRSEAELSTLKQEKKELDVNFKKISKETDEVVKDSVRRRDRAETQYEAVRSGVKSLSEGWKRDVTTLKQDICRLEEKHRKEMEDSRLKYNTLAKLHASRSGALSRIETDLNNLQSSKEGFIAKYTSELSGLRAHLEEEEKKSSEGLQLAKEVSDECARFKRILRNHSTGSSSSAAAAPGPPHPKLKP